MISDRKLSHIMICRDFDVSYKKGTHLDDVELIHCALPELDLEEIDISTRLFGKTISAPIIISSMTGGHPETKKINERLAKAANKLGIGLCVGSQRAALENPALEDTFRVVREISKDLLVIANIGAAQLLSPKAREYAEEAISMIDADALAVHLNPLQELVQPGGDVRFKGVINALSDLANSLNKPLIVKEIGCGISREVARELVKAGVSAIDVAGAGGTSWAAVEFYNSKQRGDILKSEVAETFWDWGIPTAMSLCEVLSLKPKLTVISSGGIQNGLHVAKSIALGADLAGIARTLLLPAFSSDEAIVDRLSRIIAELKTSLALVGCRSLVQLKSTPLVIKGDLLNWILQRGLEVRGLDRR
ncbi:MAG: type 2 isopentenyl-diphosphate Delta-isomerase [Candidatus Verstraetearchaeota archaeon]|nr:type 2 isopentenyl-diphosphate Delta-isomerase [Candidatus Verstraetearchaeota archaeon]